MPEVPSAKLLQPNGAATNTASAKKTEAAAAPVAKTAVKEVSPPSLIIRVYLINGRVRVASQSARRMIVSDTPLIILNLSPTDCRW